MFTEIHFKAKLLRGGNLPPMRVHFLSPYHHHSCPDSESRVGRGRRRWKERVCAHTLVGHDTKGGERSQATGGHEAPETPCRTPEVSSFLRNSRCWASFPSLFPGRTGDGGINQHLQPPSRESQLLILLMPLDKAFRLRPLSYHLGNDGLHLCWRGIMSCP